MNPWEASPDDVKSAATTLIDSEPELYKVVGLFLQCFGAVEHELDRFLIHILQIQNFERYDILAKGLDPRTKMRRIKEAAELRDGKKLGEILRKCLNHFDKCIDKRNALSHGRLSLEKGKIVSVSPGRMDDPSRIPERPNRLQPVRYLVTELYREAIWMNDFCADLRKLAPKTWRKRLPKVIDIARPHCHLPPADPSDQKGGPNSQSKDRKPQKSPGAKPQAKQPKS